MAKHSEVNDEAWESNLLVKDMFSAGIKKEKPAELGETTPSVKI
jgi:hypothetical protein